jgi:type III pantothenate kinase
MYNLLIDIGNTSCKACFASVGDGMLGKISRYEGTDVKSFLSNLLEEKERSEGKPCVAALSSVRRNDKELNEFLSSHAGKRFLNVSWRDKELKKDFPILREMPDGMGADRMAHIVAACEMFKGENVMVMDLGTAITVEFIAADGHYQGGNISIGLNTRYKALHKYCAKIPLVKPPLVRKAGSMLPESPIGMNLDTALDNGLIRGILFEIQGYQSHFPHYRMILTGGDAIYFVENLKNSIFVVYNLVLPGLARMASYYALTD